MTKKTLADCRFRLNGYAGPNHPGGEPGTVVIITTHNTEGSAYVELEAFRARMKRGDISRVEMIATHRDGTTTRMMIVADTVIPWSWT